MTNENPVSATTLDAARLPSDFDIRAFALEKAIHVRPYNPTGENEESADATIARAGAFEDYLRQGYVSE
jgi:hypothetical protein